MKIEHEDIFYKGEDILIPWSPMTMRFEVNREKNSIWKRISEIFKFIFIGKMEFNL